MFCLPAVTITHTTSVMRMHVYATALRKSSDSGMSTICHEKSGYWYIKETPLLWLKPPVDMPRSISETKQLYAMDPGCYPTQYILARNSAQTMHLQRPSRVALRCADTQSRSQFAYAKT